MGQLIGIIYICRHFITVFPVKMPKHILISFLACSQDYQLYVILTQFIHDIGNQVKPFLVRKP